MKKCIAFVVFFLLKTSLFSQTYFNERYGITPNSLDGSRTIIYDNGKIVVEDNYVSSQSDFLIKYGIISLDVYGGLIDKKIIFDDTVGVSHSRSNNSFQRFSSTSLYSVGVMRKFSNTTEDYGSLIKLDNNYDTIWTESYGNAVPPFDTNYYFENYSTDANGDLTIVGEIGIGGSSSKVLLLKVDSLGNCKWERHFESGNFNLGTDILTLPDGGNVVSCYKWVFQSSVSHNYLIRTDSMGNELWRRYVGGDLDDGPLFLAWSKNDSTIVGAYHTADSAITNADSYNRLALIKVDVDNNLIYDNKYMPEKDYDQYNFKVNGIKIDSFYNIIVVGTTYEPAPTRGGYLFKFSNEGDSLWYRQYQKSYSLYADNELFGVTPMPDGGYSASGFIWPYPPDTGNQDVWVIKVDSMGCIAQNDCWVGTKEIKALESKESMKIYPNPATNRIVVEVPRENENDDFVLTIWDLYGRKVKEVLVPSGQTEVELDISDYAAGLFNVTATNKGNNVGNGKFMKY